MCVFVFRIRRWLAFVVSLALGLYVAVVFYVQYTSDPMVAFEQPEKQSIDGTSFPAVTVCPVNRVSVARLNSALAKDSR